MKRILVIGPGGAGKTAFSKKLGERLRLPVVHLDALYWRPGWQPTPADEWVRAVEEVVSTPSWIMDGNYGGTLKIRLARADAVVFLDMPRLLCVARVLWRRVAYAGRSRPSVAQGCPERITWEFLHWIWTYRREKRPGFIAQLKAVDSEIPVVILRWPGEVRRYLSTVESSTARDRG